MFRVPGPVSDSPESRAGGPGGSSRVIPELEVLGSSWHDHDHDHHGTGMITVPSDREYTITATRRVMTRTPGPPGGLRESRLRASFACELES